MSKIYACVWSDDKATMMHAMRQMVKLDIKKLKKAFEHA